jgi:hypothetical protein
MMDIPNLIKIRTHVSDKILAQKTAEDVIRVIKEKMRHDLAAKMIDQYMQITPYRHHTEFSLSLVVMSPDEWFEALNKAAENIVYNSTRLF